MKNKSIFKVVLSLALAFMFTVSSIGYVAGSHAADDYTLLGDVNGSGKIDAGDATMVLRHVVGNTKLNKAERLAADVNGNNNVDAGDATMILRTVVARSNHMHSYKAKTTKKTTCTEDGIKTYTCSCGDKYTETIPATGHNYTPKVTKEPSCESKGTKTFTCSNCKNSYTEDIPAKGHDWNTETIHHDAEYKTRDVTEKYWHLKHYDIYHITTMGVEIGLRAGDFTSLRADAEKLGLDELVRCIDEGRIGNYEQTIASNPLFPHHENGDPAGSDYETCMGHLFVCSSDRIFKDDNPYRAIIQIPPGETEGSKPEYTLNFDEDVTNIYRYCDHYEYHERLCADGTFEKGYSPVDSFRHDMFLVEKSHKRPMTNDVVAYVFGNWTSHTTYETFDKVIGTEEYLVEAYDETVTTCANCGKTK